MTITSAIPHWVKKGESEVSHCPTSSFSASLLPRELPDQEIPRRLEGREEKRGRETEREAELMMHVVLICMKCDIHNRLVYAMGTSFVSRGANYVFRGGRNLCKGCKVCPGE